MVMHMSKWCEDPSMRFRLLGMTTAFCIIGFYHYIQKMAIIFSSVYAKLKRGGVFMKEKKEEIIITDPFGSYTGLVKDPKEKPVQDADDL